MRKILLGVYFIFINIFIYSENLIRSVAISTVKQGFQEGFVEEIRKLIGHTNISQGLKMIFIAATMRLLMVFLIIFIGRKIIKLTTKLVLKLEEKGKVEKSLGVFLVSLHKFVSYFVLSVIVLRALGIQESSLASVVGVAGVGIGFASKDILGNFVGGTIILTTKPYKIGDFVEIGGASGTVKTISVYSTELDTIDNKKLVIPNGQIITDKVINYSGNHVRRVEIIYGISYNSDFRRAIEILHELANNNKKIIQKIEKTIRVIELGASSVNIRVRVWCKTEDYLDVLHDMLEEGKEAFDREGIEIPFPQMDVHVKNEELNNIPLENFQLEKNNFEQKIVK